MDKKLIEVPKHLKSDFQKLFLVQRFKTYEGNILKDNTAEHTLRGIALINTLPFDDNSKDKVKAVFWPHDIPEIIISDYTAIEKLDEKLAKSLERKEDEAAKRLLNKQDYLMLNEFNVAAKILKGERTEKIPSPEAVVAYVVDVVEGNTFFHRNITNWIVSDSYNPTHIPSEKALSYTFKMHALFVQNLPKCNLTAGYQKAAEYLLKFQLDEVAKAWVKVPLNLIPPTTLKGINENL
jgi:hypothetical protein